MKEWGAAGRNKAGRQLSGNVAIKPARYLQSPVRFASNGDSILTVPIVRMD
jgi:hypothetical protein